jgi:hypothetical protein
MGQMQYLAAWRMHLARRLLSESPLGLGEIAARVGYDSEAAFNRAFRRAVGIPSASWPGTCGGKSNVGLGSDGAVNLPEDGRYAVSLFAHHGDKDTTVPPGDWGADDFDYQAPQFPDKGYLMYAIAGFPSALDYRPGYLPLSQASRGYRTYNTLEGQSPFRDRVGLGGASTARSKSWPNGENPDDHNPTVVIYRDSEMDHTNFTKNESKRYFFEKDVWRFFNRHHRSIRPPSHEPAPIEIAQAVSVKTNAEAPSM